MRIFFDVDTQGDFMNKNGALYVPDAERIKPALKALTIYAKRSGILIFGSLDKHFGTEEYRCREGELQRWGGPFPDHCMIGTPGQEKIAETFIDEDALLIPHLPTPINLVQNISARKGIYFEKQSYDVFANSSAERVLEKAGVHEAIVYGVATDFCVKAAVLGMQKQGIQCYLVLDAIKGVFPDTTASALDEMAKAGARFVNAGEVFEERI